ncbi:hypothetical protein CDAR_621711 [Caerostris darwini]|uniref:Uncharacterized protein n=1 Tax=Caerostris darwini TaxID=1538125 RepID=A0AAV4P8P0_9ARAC|nr:hypothetical protein CDAR_621711 [Caerostris darwini]
MHQSSISRPSDWSEINGWGHCREEEEEKGRLIKMWGNSYVCCHGDLLKPCDICFETRRLTNGKRGPGPGNSRLGHSQAISARLLTEEQGIVMSRMRSVDWAVRLAEVTDFSVPLKKPKEECGWVVFEKVGALKKGGRGNGREVLVNFNWGFWSEDFAFMKGGN